jgi:hypothetical protein
MINFFTPATNDASLTYLSTIFGNMNGVIPGTGGTLTILGTMFRTFNSIALAVGALIVVYITVVGVIMTAHEGEFMKKWNSLWTPIRTVIGIASLVPTASGFSGLQILMMWVIVQGVGAADTLWNTVLSYVNVAGSPYAQIQLHDVGVSQAVSDLYKGIVCDQTARATYSPPYVTSPQSGSYYCNASTNSFCSSTNNLDPAATSVNSFEFGPSGACGTLTYCNQSTLCTDASSLKCMTCKAQVTALANIISTLRNVADIYIKADYDYQNYYYNGYLSVGTPNPDVPMPEGISAFCAAKGIPASLCRGPAMQSSKTVPGGLSDDDPLAGTGNASNAVVKDIYLPYFLQPVLGSDSFLDTGITYYMNAITTAVSTYLASQGSNDNTLPTQLANAQKTGWIFAGGYYYTLTQVNNNNLKDARPDLTTTMTDPQTGTPDNPNALQNYRNNFSASDVLINTMAGNTSSGSAASNVVSSGAGAVTDTMIQVTSPGGSNPLVQLAAAGYALLFAAQITFAVFLAISLALGVISGLNAFVLGTGGFNPMAVATPVTYMILVPLTAALLGIMVSLGALLGVYVPLIPYVIFTFGAIGWLTSTIETMVAGPLVALAILAPGGHHEILGKAEPALMLLFNVFIRPSLMIFGLVAAMLLASVVLTMINAMFGQVLLQIIGTGTGSLDNSNGQLSQGLQIAAAAANPLEMIFFLMAYVLLIIGALNKCFAAIHIIPERVMRWMGGQGEQYGESEGLGEMKRGIEGGAERGAALGKEMGKTTEGVGEVKGKKQEADKVANKPTTTTDTNPPPP